MPAEVGSRGVCKSFPQQGLMSFCHHRSEKDKSHKQQRGGSRKGGQASVAVAEKPGRGCLWQDPKHPMTPGYNTDDVSRSEHQKMYENVITLNRLYKI